MVLNDRLESSKGKKMIEVVLNDRLGKKVRVKCNEDDTIGDLKKLVAAQTGTRPDKIRIQKWYTIYKDHITLKDYEIHDGMGLELYYNWLLIRHSILPPITGTAFFNLFRLFSFFIQIPVVFIYILLFLKWMLCSFLCEYLLSSFLRWICNICVTVFLLIYEIVVTRYLRGVNACVE